MAKEQIGFRLTEETVTIIKEMATRLGVSQAAVVEMAVRLLAEERLKRR